MTPGVDEIFDFLIYSFNYTFSNRYFLALCFALNLVSFLGERELIYLVCIIIVAPAMVAAINKKAYGEVLPLAW